MRFGLSPGKENDLKERTKTVKDAIKSAEQRKENAEKSNVYLKAIFDALLTEGSFDYDGLGRTVSQKDEITNEMELGIYCKVIQDLEAEGMITRQFSCSGCGS